MEAYLSNDCALPCLGRHTDCPQAVKQNPATGRWFITIGHPGFNSRVNNGEGYTQRSGALAAYRAYRGGYGPRD